MGVVGSEGHCTNQQVTILGCSFEDVVAFRCRSQTGINSPVMSKKKDLISSSVPSAYLIGLVLSTLTDLIGRRVSFAICIIG